MLNIVFLDGRALNPGDLSFAPLEAFGNFTLYDRTPQEEVVLRAREADVLIVNKRRLGDEEFAQLPRLCLVLVSSTGYDTVDVEAARRHGVLVCNVPAYSTMAVAQHTLALLLEVCNSVGHYAQLNREGYWSRSRDFCLWDAPVVELSGLPVALVGLGNIGMKVAELLHVLGAKVWAVTSRAAETLPDYITKVSLEEAVSTAHFLSLHCPLTPSTRALINAQLLTKAQPDLVIVNTARGALIDDEAVATALHEGRLRAYAADVLSQEPPSASHPLLHAPRTYLTPHIAWASAAARMRIVDIMASNLQAFLDGRPQNVVS